MKEGTVKRKLLFATIAFVILAAGFVIGVLVEDSYAHSSIRKYCSSWALSKGSYPASKNNLYRQCLIQNGHAPESMYVNL